MACSLDTQTCACRCTRVHVVRLAHIPLVCHLARYEVALIGATAKRTALPSPPHPWVLAACGWVILTIASLVAYYAAVLPDPRDAGVFKQPPNLTILARGGEFIGERGMRRAYVPYKDIPPDLVKAVLATEDRRFFYHFGLDPIGLLRASAGIGAQAKSSRAAPRSRSSS